MKLSDKQRMVLETIMRGHQNEEGVVVDWLDINEVVEAVPYKVTKDALQFTVRTLLKKKLIYRTKRIMRRHRWVTLLVPTDLAYDILAPQNGTGGQLEIDDDVILEGF